jgi:hypothetical protein
MLHAYVSSRKLFLLVKQLRCYNNEYVCFDVLEMNLFFLLDFPLLNI